MKPKNINNFTTEIGTSFNDILKKISKNLFGIIFLVDKNNKLIGSIGDGDIRRYILKYKNIKEKVNLNSKLINKKVKVIYVEDKEKKLFNLLERGFKVVPKLNKKRQIIDICTYKNIRNIRSKRTFLHKNILKRIC